MRILKRKRLKYTYTYHRMARKLFVSRIKLQSRRKRLLRTLLHAAYCSSLTRLTPLWDIWWTTHGRYKKRLLLKEYTLVLGGGILKNPIPHLFSGMDS